MTNRFITGATGFVGGAIALELLDRTEGDLFALSRGRDLDAAKARLLDRLGTMAEGYGRPDLVPQVLERVHPVLGDVKEPFCGPAAENLPDLDEVWHCAADLHFEEELVDDIMASNVGGTTHVLDLARRKGVRAFNHISTAYVAGTRTGVVLEGPAAGPHLANNAYERSKMAGEKVVEESAGDFTVRIMRPSVVVGHSRTRYAMNWSGLYGFAKWSKAFDSLARRRLGTYLRHARVRLRADPNGLIDFVPIDSVAGNAVSIALSDSPETYFHLTNPYPVTISGMMTTILEDIGMRAPEWVQDGAEFTGLDAKLDGGMAFYGSYINNPKVFDATNTAAACGVDSIAVPVTRQDISEYIAFCLRQPAGGAPRPERVLHRAAAQPAA